MINEEDDFTWIAERLIAMFSRIELAPMLGMTRPTLNSRLKGKTEWGLLERKELRSLRLKHIPNERKKRSKYERFYKV